MAYLFGSLGDSIVAIPALRAVRRRFPDAEIVLLQNFTAGNLVQASEVIPETLVDRHLSYNSGLGRIAGMANFFGLWLKLRGERFDAAVYLVISERAKKSVVRDRIFFRSCGISTLYGFHAFDSSELFPVDGSGHPAMTDHEAVRKLRRLGIDGLTSVPEDLALPLLEFSPAEINETLRWLSEHRQRPDRPLVAIAPGCKTKANVWPVENFIELGRRLITEENCEIIVVGGSAERKMGDSMIAAWGGGINAAGMFSVRQSGSLLSNCDLYIGLDTGTTHLAAVAGTRCFALYGERNNPGHWFPLGTRNKVLFHRVECAGCRLQDCPVPGHPCMTGISVEFAWENLRQFIRKPDDKSESVIAV